MLDLPDMFEEDAIHQFIQGLQYEPHLQVFLKTPTTLKAAYAAAVKCVKGIREPIPPHNNHQSHFQDRRSDGLTPMELDTIYNNHRGRHWSKRCPRTTQCFNCQGFGHVARQCPSPSRKKFKEPLKGTVWQV